MWGPRVTYTPVLLNFTFWAVGMAGVWFVTHSWLALAFTWIASIHITFSVKGGAA